MASIPGKHWGFRFSAAAILDGFACRNIDIGFACLINAVS
jgi:hypothetical protein